MSDDNVLDVNLTELKVSEIEEIEAIIEQPIDYAFRAEAPRGKVLRALGYVIKRRTNPEFTLEDAGNLIVRLAAEEEPTPTSAAG